MRVRRIPPPLINLNPRIRRPEMLVLHNARQQLIRIRILRCPALPHINPPGSHVEKVINHTRTHKKVPSRVIVTPPRIARPIRKHLKLPLRLLLPTLRPRPPNPRIKLEPLALRLPRTPHLAVRENPVRHVQPSIRPPGKTVHQLMRVLPPKPRQHHPPRLRLVIPISIFEVNQMRRLPHINPVVPTQNRTRQIQPLHKNRPLVRLPIAIRVLKNDHPIPRNLALHLRHRPIPVILHLTPKRRRMRRPLRILIRLHHPQPTPMIPRHRHRILHHQLMRKTPHLIPLRHTHLLPRLLRRRTNRLRLLPLPLNLRIRRKQRCPESKPHQTQKQTCHETKTSHPTQFSSSKQDNFYEQSAIPKKPLCSSVPSVVTPPPPTSLDKPPLP